MKKKSPSLLVVAILGLVLGWNVAPWSVKAFQNVFSPSERYTALVNKVIPTVVDIKVPVIEERFSLNITSSGDLTITKSTFSTTFEGAGVFISQYGHILTCAHLFPLTINGKVRVTLYNGHVVNARLLWVDKKKDLALLKVFTFYESSAILTTRKLQQGQEVIAIGSPLGLPFSVSHGIVSFVNRKDKGLNGFTQSDTFVNPGNSGGPLFNLKGELVGINSFILPPVDAPIFTGLGFSVSPEEIREFLHNFEGIVTIQ